jgi:hypothetical protein
MKRKLYRRKFNYFNILVFITMIISVALLIHDFIFWGVIPMFTGTFYQLTYFGLFIDVIAIIMLDVSIQYIKEWF